MKSQVLNSNLLRQQVARQSLVAILIVGQITPAWTLGQSPAPPAPANAKPAKPSATAIADKGWPRVYTDGTATIAVHQPQVDDWKDFQLLSARSAMEISPAKGAKKLLAATHWEAQTDTNLDTRMVVLRDLKFTRFNIPGSEAGQAKTMEELVRKLLPTKYDAVAIERILPYLDPRQAAGHEVQISTEAPPILVSTKPAILVMVDGQPILGPVQNTKLTYLVNTNWDILKQTGDDEFYLLNERQWLTAKNLEGPWTAASKLPKELNKLPADTNWADARKALPLSPDNKKSTAPWVYVSYKPAELVLLAGEPILKPVAGTAISEVTNTKSLLFFHNNDRHYYFLASGRWFRNQQLRGVWEFASDKLPADFAKIPASHPKAHVLASVPGTPEAADAVLLASVPQMAVINRKEAAAQAKVTYIGAPEFKPVEGTSLTYAVNTPSDVLKHQDKYYLLQEGVWFVSAAASGPWEVADLIPPEIYKIPPQSPKHNTTYVYVTESNTETVTTAQTAGYMGLAIGIGIGVAVWGTGYYYPPYYYMGPMYPYPVYWGYPYHSYGAAAWYNPATGFYGRGAVAYGPYGGYGRSAAYNPATGTYARRAGAYGPYQAGMATSFYNPRTGAWGGGYRYANPYQGWGQGVVAKGDQWAKGGYYYDDRGAVGGIRTSEGGKLVAAGNGDNRGAIGRTSDGDLYVGKDGDIYKRDQSGQWQQHGEGGWSNVNKDNLSADQQQRLNDARAQHAPNATQNSANRSATRENRATQTPSTMPATRENRAAQTPSAATRPSSASRESLGNLDRDAGARARGNQSYQYNRSSGSRSGSSYGGGMRSGGGGFRGGGRRR